MAEYSRFFDHIDGDRSYNADDFAEYFRQVLTNGILNGGENLQVYVNGTDRIARIKPGKAWLEGYFYKLTDELQLPLEEAHGTYDRIDRIVIGLNTNTDVRSIKAYVKTGLPAFTPVAPEITREEKIYEISLAQILVVHNTTAVPIGNVTDERLDPNVCGLVNSLIQVDTATMQAEFETFMDTLAGQSYVSRTEFIEHQDDTTTHMTPDEKSKLEGIADGAQVNTVTSVNSKTGAVKLTPSDVGAATSAQGTLANNALPKAGGTMTGILIVQSNTSYTTRQVHNIILSTADADVNAMQNGDIWIKYK